MGASRRTTGMSSPECISASARSRPLAELAAGVQMGEVVLPETAPDQQRHRERIAERQRGRRARGRREIHRTRLFGHVTVQRDVGGPAERRLGLAGQGNEPRADPLDGFEQRGPASSRFAAGRQRDDHIVGLDDAQIPVHRFGRMQEVGRACRCSTTSRRSSGDDAGLAHAGHDHAATAGVEHLDGAFEPLVQLIHQAENRLGFGLEDSARERQRRFARGVGSVDGTGLAGGTEVFDGVAMSADSAASRSGPARPHRSRPAGGAAARAGRGRARSARRSWPARVRRGLPGTRRRRPPRRRRAPAARCTRPDPRSRRRRRPGSCRLCVTSNTTGTPRLAHHRERPHVDHQVVVAEEVPRSVTNTRSLPESRTFCDGVADVERARGTDPS